MPDWIEIERRRLLAEAEAEFWECDREEKQLPLARGWWIIPALAVSAVFWLAVFIWME